MSIEPPASENWRIKPPLDPEERERRERRMALVNDDGYVILVRKPGDPAIYGYIEHSFAMDYSSKCVRFWWSGKGRDNIVGALHTVEGRKNADYNAAQIRHEGWDVKVWRVTDPELPVEIDWPGWAAAAGKFADRNPNFRMKEQASG